MIRSGILNAGVALAALAIAGLASAAASAGEDAIRIAVVNDQSGPFSDYGGAGSVIAAKLAIDEFGGKVLGKPIEIVGVDHQNKPDVAANIVREMFDARDFDVIMDGAASSAALAMQAIARERGKIFLINGAATGDLTGKECSPTGIHISADTYSIAKGAVQAVTQSGRDSWFFITADYAFGHALESQANAVVAESGGTVLGAVKHPMGTLDYSSYILAAQASGAKAIGIANAGGDLVNAIKASQEFGVAEGGQTIVGFLLDFIDINALGPDAAQGISFVVPFYWDLNEETRAFTKRFMEAGAPRPPSHFQAGAYAAMLHYLKAVEAAGTDDGPTVAGKMREMPMNDMYHAGSQIREDGRVLNDLYLMEVKKPSDIKYEYDYLRVVATLPGDSGVYRSIAEGGCSYVQQ